jgi:peptide/nickel transport system substrate-binding protein
MTAPQACVYWGQAEEALWRDVDMAPLSSRPLSYYLKNAQAKLNGYDFPMPMSIRVTD